MVRPRNDEMTTVRLFFVASAALLGLLFPGAGWASAVGAPAEEQAKADEPWMKELDAQYPVAPEGILKEFIEAAKGEPRYQVARFLERETVAPLISKWSEEQGFQLVPEYRRFLEELTDWDEIGGDRDQTFVFSQQEFDADGFQLPLVVLTHLKDMDEDDEPDEVVYRVPPRQLSALDFDFLCYVSIINPLNRMLGSFSAVDGPLTEVVSELCRTADVDFVSSSDSENRIRVTLSLKKKRVIECIWLAAAVGGRRIADEDGDNFRPRDGSVEFGEVSETYWKRRFLNEWEGITPAVETPVDALRHLVLMATSEMREERQVILLLPPKER